jgi:hypothetical protein
MAMLSELELTEEIIRRQGTDCIVPDCSEPWTDKAHIEASGMGGRPSLRTPENNVGLCRPHHDRFDGRELTGRQHLLRQLMRSLADRVAADRKAFT